MSLLLHLRQQLASVDGDVLMILSPDSAMPWQACRSKPHTKLDEDGNSHCAALREIRCALWGPGSGALHRLTADPAVECMPDTAPAQVEPAMPTASARFRRPRPQPRVISQLELLVSRLMDELGPVLLLVSANSRDGSQAWVEAFTEFRAFAHARWATIQESLSRACKYIALGADNYAAEFAEIAAEDADLASHLNDARARVSASWRCHGDEDISWL